MHVSASSTPRAGAKSSRRPRRIGVLQLHLSGGEPASRRDLVELVAHAASLGLYTNLITSGIGLNQASVTKLAEAGLDHVQLSIQDSEPQSADRIAGYKGAFARKIEVAAFVTEAGLPLTVNAVIHRANVRRAGAMVELAVRLGARRVEIAHTQYYGWAREKPRSLDALARRGGGGDRGGRAPEGKPRGHDRDRPCRSRLSRALPEALHVGMGAAHAECDALGQGAALPRGRAHSRPRILERHGAFARGHLESFARLQRLPGRRLDARALPLLRAQERSISAAAAARPSC